MVDIKTNDRITSYISPKITNKKYSDGAKHHTRKSFWTTLNTGTS